MVDRWLCDLTPSQRHPVYTRANAGEVLPHVASPLSWSTVWTQGVMPGWRDSFVNIGTLAPDEVEVDEVVGLFGGRLYINASTSRIFGVRAPGLTAEMIDETYFGDHPDVPPYVAEPWHEREESTVRLGAWMAEALVTDLSELLDDQREADEVRAARPDLGRLDDQALVDRMRSLLPLVRRLFERHLTVTGGGSVGLGIVGGVAAALGDPSITLRLVSAVGDVDSALPSGEMWKLSRLDPESAEFRSRFDDFLATYGSRGPNEWDLLSDTWETDPKLALDLIAVMRKQGDDGDPSVRHDAQATDREAATAHVRSALAGDADALAQFEAGLASAHRYLAGRERAKTNIIKVIHEVRMAARELASRHARSVDEFHMLLDEELDAFLAAPDGFHARLSQRLEDYEFLGELDPPFIVNGSVPPLSEWARIADLVSPAAEVGESIPGMPGCPGSVTGTARIVLDPADPLALEPGEILVAPLTDPAWTPLFVPAAGVVVDVGAAVSHAIIVSRELGIPCVVSATGATARIPDGATVTVDGDAGVVTVDALP